MSFLCGGCDRVVCFPFKPVLFSFWVVLRYARNFDLGLREKYETLKARLEGTYGGPAEVLFVSNSLPVRHVDTFCSARKVPNIMSLNHIALPDPTPGCA